MINRCAYYMEKKGGVQEKRLREAAVFPTVYGFLIFGHHFDDLFIRLLHALAAQTAEALDYDFLYYHRICPFLNFLVKKLRMRLKIRTKYDKIYKNIYL